LAEYKKRLDEELSTASAAEEYKKKIAHDVEVLQEKVKTLLDTNDKLNKSKKKLMSEVCAILILLQECFSDFFLNTVPFLSMCFIIGSVKRCKARRNYAAVLAHLICHSPVFNLNYYLIQHD